MKTLNYFKKNYPEVKQLGDITWSHAVNSQKRASQFIGNPEVMFIESDVRLSDNGAIIMAYPPDNTSDLTFAAFLTKMVNSKQGLKLDFKDPEALTACLEFLSKLNLVQPVMLNADIVQGNKAAKPKFNACDFIATSVKFYSEGILSLGWTTTTPGPYLKENIDEMLDLCESINWEITFPVRACLLPHSFAKIKRLLQKKNHTLTIWNNEPISEDLKGWIKKNTDRERTYYDFIDENKNPIFI